VRLDTAGGRGLSLPLVEFQTLEYTLQQLQPHQDGEQKGFAQHCVNPHVLELVDVLDDPPEDFSSLEIKRLVDEQEHQNCAHLDSLDYLNLQESLADSLDHIRLRFLVAMNE
jgi:hypothetical protein